MQRSEKDTIRTWKGHPALLYNIFTREIAKLDFSQRRLALGICSWEWEGMAKGIGNGKERHEREKWQEFERKYWKNMKRKWKGTKNGHGLARGEKDMERTTDATSFCRHEVAKLDFHRPAWPWAFLARNGKERTEMEWSGRWMEWSGNDINRHGKNLERNWQLERNGGKWKRHWKDGKDTETYCIAMEAKEQGMEKKYTNTGIWKNMGRNGREV